MARQERKTAKRDAPGEWRPAGRGVTRKFVGYLRLVEACDRPGCPICQCVDADGRRHLDALLWEHVNDPETRRRLRGSWGFCNWHVGMLLEVANAPSGAAILYEDLLRLFLRRAQRLRDRSLASSAGLRGWLRGLVASSSTRPAIVDWYRRRLRCPICAGCHDAEARYIDAMVRFADDPPFARAYDRSTGLCAPHMLQAIERGAGTVAVSRLLSRTIEKWEQVRRDLERFVAKHDYRNAAPFSEAEASAALRAFEVMSGKRGVFGNDLHRDPSRDGGRPRTPACALAIDDRPPHGDADPDVLQLRVTELTKQLNEASSRAAALHFRLARVAEDRNVLELNLSGERGTTELAMRTIEDLRAENERLRAELAEARQRTC